MRLTLCFLGSICFCTYANSQFLNITNTNEIPAGWAIVGKTPNSNGTVYTIENLNKYAPDANATIYPIGNTMPVGWQVISISGSNVDNIRWTIKKTKGMAKGSIIMVCMNDRLGSEWEQVSTSSCGNCALLTQTSGVCYTIRKITEGDSPAVNNQNNNNGTSKQVYGGINPPQHTFITGVNPDRFLEGYGSHYYGPEPIYVEFLRGQIPAMRKIQPKDLTINKNMAFLSFYSNENKYAIKVFIRPENEVTSRYVGRVIYYNENNKTPDCNQAGSLNVRVSPGRWYISFEYDIREQAFTDPRTLWDTWVDVSNGTGVYVSASSRMMEGSYSCDWKSLY